MSGPLSTHFVTNMNLLRSHNTDQFYLNILSLHLSDWSLQEIADSFGVSKSAAANWEKKGKKLSESKIANDSDVAIPTKEKKTVVSSSKTPKAVPVDLPVPIQQTILKLAQMASKVSRNTPLDAPSRQAAIDLENLLYHYKMKGVSYSKLAAAAGVTRRAIAQRIEKKKKELDDGL